MDIMTSTTNGAEQLVAGSAPAATEHAIPIFEVAFRNDMWWSIPASMSAALYEKYASNDDADYAWDWGDARSGSWAPMKKRRASIAMSSTSTHGNNET